MSKQGLTHSRLIEAIRQGSLHGVISALESGCNIEEADIHGQRGLPLRTACFSGKPEIVRTLLEQGANVNAAGADGPGMPLRLALRARNPEIVRLLLDSGAQIPLGVLIPEDYLTPPEAPAVPPPSETAVLEAPTLDIPPMEFAAVEAESSPEDFIPLLGQRLPTADQNGNTPVAYAVDEEVDITGNYGIDTNLLNLDIQKQEETAANPEPTKAPAPPSGKGGFWKSKRPG